jgi:hypothetical protein
MKKQQSAFEAQHRTLSFHRADMSGPLFKRRGGYGKHMPNSWQSRYFFLIDGNLWYYDSEHVDNGVLLSPDAQPRGSIALSGAKCVFNECAEGEPTEFAIIIYPENKEKWKLCAENLVDYKRWIEALKRFVGQHEEIDELVSEAVDEDHLRPQPPSSALVSASNTPRQVSGSLGAIAHASRRTSFSSGKKGGKRIRLKKNSGSYFTSEMFESAFVIAILNLCILLAIESSAYEGIAYLLLANFVVLRYTYLIPTYTWLCII